MWLQVWWILYTPYVSKMETPRRCGHSVVDWIVEVAKSHHFSEKEGETTSKWLSLSTANQTAGQSQLKQIVEKSQKGASDEAPTMAMEKTTPRPNGSFRRSCLVTWVRLDSRSGLVCVWCDNWVCLCPALCLTDFIIFARHCFWMTQII